MEIASQTLKKASQQQMFARLFLKNYNSHDLLISLNFRQHQVDISEMSALALPAWDSYISLSQSRY